MLVSRSGIGLLEVKALLYGDLLLASSADLAQILLFHIPLLVLLLLCIRPLLFAFIDANGAKISGLPVTLLEFGFFIALGLLISSAAKTAGSLLVFCYLSVPPAIGLMMSKSLPRVMTIATGCGIVATLIGLTASYHLDLPGNQCIIVAACLLLLVLPSAQKIFLLVTTKYVK